MSEPFAWNPAKSAELLKRHGVGFADVVIAYSEKRVLSDIPHPSEKFAHQRMAVVLIGDYVYAVPYVMDGETRFLKTLFPSRKLQRRFHPGALNNED